MDRRRERPEPDSAAQWQRFKETARTLGCDEDEAAFDEKLKAIARQQPKGAPKHELKRSKAVPNKPD